MKGDIFMYVNETTGLTEYEAFEEILNADIIEFTEDENNYYIRTKPQQYFENNIWIIDKKTEKVSFMYYTQYICDVIDNVTPVNPESLKRVG